MQGVRWVWNLRARSSALSMQGVRWVSNLRARPYTLSVQGVRWVRNLRARSFTLSVQGVSRRELMKVLMNAPLTAQLSSNPAPLVTAYRTFSRIVLDFR